LPGALAVEPPELEDASVGMSGAGGKIGGGECNRSMTDFATSAAERMLGTAGPGAFAARRGLTFFGEALEVALGAAFGRLRAARTGFAAGLRTAGLSLSVAAGLGARRVAVTAAASTFRHACFAAFFSVLNSLRACLSCAFAARTWVFAAAARAAALVAASLSRLMNGERLVI
jgi:hypothetical protein